MKQVHPADIAGAAIIANAVRFEVALFIGRGKYAHASARTLAEARDVAAPALEAEHPYGRRALIYAIDAAGRQALVPAGYRPPPHRHDDPDGLPEILCRKCHPETNLTPEECQELEAAELGRPPLPSAIARQGEPAMKIYAKKFNAERAAKAAGHSLDAIEIVKAKGGFAWRLKRQPKTDPRDAKLAPDPSREPQSAATAPKRPLGKHARIEAEARAGKLPEPPDFSAETHKRFRNKLAAVVALAEAGDLEGLRAFKINPVSSSPKAIARYRDLCILALEARK